MKILTKKKQDEILKRIAANEIISGDAFAEKMTADSFTEIIENNAEIAFAVGGITGMVKTMNTVERYRESKLKEMEVDNGE